MDSIYEKATTDELKRRWQLMHAGLTFHDTKEFNVVDTVTKYNNVTMFQLVCVLKIKEKNK